MREQPIKTFWKGRLTHSRIKKQLFGVSGAFTPLMFGCKVVNDQKNFKCFIVSTPMESKQVTYTKDLLKGGWEIEAKTINPEDYEIKGGHYE